VQTNKIWNTVLLRFEHKKRPPLWTALSLVNADHAYASSLGKTQGIKLQSFSFSGTSYAYFPGPQSCTS
jgi:hypothetical protein